MPAAASRQPIAFGPFEFDAASGLLYRGERETLLPMRVGKVLEILLLQPGEVLTKDELLGEVWKDAFVGEDSLTQAISMLRSALGDDPRDPTYIQTIPKRGYRFIAEVGVVAEGTPVEDRAVSADPTTPLSDDAIEAPSSAEVVAFPPSGAAPAAGAGGRPPLPLVSVGSSFGHYEIVSELGAGAMGVVYRARDTKLERDVALKVLPEDFLSDPDRVARFEREAKLLAAVSHPNIAAIHSLEEEGDTKFPVMELVEGETLEERLRSGPIEVDQALEIARQIASALEAAHERGIVHRDLKPANIKITPSGQVKVLDFGLAKALEVKIWGQGAAGEGVSQSPTESMTIIGSRRGSIVGTAAYMSPEQARGQEAGKQADIWAFGCVLYEMITGKRAFGGDTVSDTLAGLLMQEPDWDDLPAKTPRAARRVLHRCLTKDPRDRLHDIADARIELKAALEVPVAGAPFTEEAPAQVSAWRRALPWGLTAASLIVAVGAVLWISTRGPAPATSPFSSRYTIDLPEEMKLSEATAMANMLAISPDGSKIAYSAFDNSVEDARSSRLYVRRLDEVQGSALPLAEVGNGGAPFFSPDGQWIAFFQGGKLKKVSASGGAPIELCEALGSGRGGTWARDNTIIFMFEGGLARVSAAGGELQVVAAPSPARGEIRYAWPRLLPGDRALAYSILTSGIQTMDDAPIAVLDLQSGDQHMLDVRGTLPTYSPTGHLIYLRDGALHAVAFDLDTYTSDGLPLQVEGGVMSSYGPPTFALSSNGTLIYVPGPAWADQWIVWLNREGEITPMADEPLAVLLMHLSPDRERVAFDIGQFNRDILLYDLSLGPRLRLRRDWDQMFETWMPDGESFIFSEEVEGRKSFYRQNVQGDEPEPLPLDFGEYQDSFLSSASPDGRWLILDALHPVTGWDLLLMPLQGEPVLQELLVTPADEQRPVFSPDGRMIAYVSDATGQNEIYVMDASQRGSSGKQASEGEAWAFRWGAGSDLIYYHRRRGRSYLEFDIMARPVQLGANVTLGEPHVAFEKHDNRFTWWSPYMWDIGRDGRLLAKMEPEAWILPYQINVVTNWFEELKRLVPTEQ
jgi:serine/threonine-protein kinase